MIDRAVTISHILLLSLKSGKVAFLLFSAALALKRPPDPGTFESSFDIPDR
jgi:hypothetical protein